jgi:hypothetical protein
MPIRAVTFPAKKRGRPHQATSALIPAAARTPDGLTVVEAALNTGAIEVFTKAVGGRQQLAEVLAVASPAGELDTVTTYLLDPRYEAWSLSRLCTHAGITVAHLFAAYKKALLVRAQIEATHIIAAKLPPVVDDVMTRAAPQRVACSCLEATRPACPTCRGTGLTTSEPAVDRQKLALELGQLLEKKGGIVMQQNTIAAGALASTRTGALEQLHQAVGDLLFSPGRQRRGAPGVVATLDEELLGDPPVEIPDPREPREEEPELPWGDPEPSGGGDPGTTN